MLTQRLIKSRLVTMTLVTLMTAGPLLQTSFAQKPLRNRAANEEDVQRGPAAPIAQRPAPGEGGPEVSGPSVNPQKGGLSVSPPTPAVPTVCTPLTITQSSSQAVTPGNSVAPLLIAPPGRYDNSSYWRAFNIANFASGSSFTIASVDIGVESVTTGPKLVKVNLWSSSAAFPLGYPNSLSLLGTASQSVGVQAGTIVNIPVMGTAPVGAQLVVEISVPGWPTDGDTSQFLIGSNTAAETGPSYVSSQLGITTPTPLATFGVPNMHIVMNVNGCSTPIGSGGPGLALSPWTATGADGTIDEDSLSIAQLSNFAIGLIPGATGTVTARYNITGVAGLSRFCPATQSKVSIRFRDNDPSAQVVVEIHRSNTDLGGNDVIYAFDSNTLGQPVGSAFQSFTTMPAIDFDFETYIYWIEARITKTDPSSYANLGSIRISETAGTACP